MQELKTFQGKPCRNGHSGLRYIRGKSCVECASKLSAKYRTKPGYKEWLANYHKNRRSPETRAADGVRHRKWRSTEKGKLSILGYHLKRQYGLSIAEFEVMVAAQDNRCMICGRSGELERYNKLSVDHDHQTNKVRELLCDDCNVGLGDFKEQPDLLEKAAAYLRKHGKE